MKCFLLNTNFKIIYFLISFTKYFRKKILCLKYKIFIIIININKHKLITFQRTLEITYKSIFSNILYL